MPPADKGAEKMPTQQQDVVPRNIADALADALESLRDYQNGCPLPKYERGWTKAMSDTRAALAAYRTGNAEWCGSDAQRAAAQLLAEACKDSGDERIQAALAAYLKLHPQED